jgi:hypothetical protein
VRVSARLPGWLQRLDLLTPVVGAAALVIYLLHGFDGYLSRDLATYGYGGQQVVDGVPPYLGILNRAGPLAQLIPAVGVAVARIGGFDDLLGMRLVYTLISVACACLVYVLARDLFASTAAGLVASAAFLSFGGFIELASNGPREKTPMVLFLVCVFLAVNRRRWLAAGLCLALATLTWQLSFVVGVTALAVAVVMLPGSERRAAAVRIVVGGLIPTAMGVVYFALVGGLREFFDAFVVINAEYDGSRPVFSHLGDSWSSLRYGYGISLWILLAGLAALLALAGWEVWHTPRSRQPTAMPTVALGAGGVAGLAALSLAFDRWPDVLMLLPLAAVGIGGVLHRLAGRVQVKVVLPVAVVWVVACVAVAGYYSISRRSHTLDIQRDSVASVLDKLPSDATFLSLGAPEGLVLAGKTNPTRYQMFIGPLRRYVDDTWPGGLKGYSRWISKDQPTVILLGGRRQVLPRLEHFIAEDYRRIGAAPGWTWYVNVSVGPDVVRDLRAAEAGL